MPGQAQGQTQAQAQLQQQQAQVNSMLNQLPQQQKDQIQQAVNSYRQQLLQQGFSADVVQTYVWSYYTQCVQTLFQEFKKSEQAPESSIAEPQELQQEQAQNECYDQTGQLEQQQEQQQALQQQAQRLQVQQQLKLAQRQQLQQQQFQLQQSRQLQQQIQANMLGQQMGSAQGVGVVGAQSMGSSMMGSTVPGIMGGFNTGMGALGASAAVKQLQQQQQPPPPPPPPPPQDQEGTSIADCAMGGGLGQNHVQGQTIRPPNSLAQQVAMSAAHNAAFTSMSMAAQTPKMGQHVPPWKRPQGPLGPGMVNGPGAGLQFPLSMRPRGMGMRADTPAARLHMQQAQHEQRLMQQGVGSPSMAQWGQGTQMGHSAAAAFPSKGPPAAFRGPQSAVGRGLPRPVGAIGMAGAGAGPSRPSQQFPPALQSWLQRLFAHQTQSGENDRASQQQTHTYLKHWVQQWVKTNELWQKNWDLAPLPTPDEIRLNLPPGSLSGQAAVVAGAVGAVGVVGATGSASGAGAMPGMFCGGQRPRPPCVVPPLHRRGPGEVDDGPGRRSDSNVQRQGDKQRHSRDSPQKSPTYRSRSRSGGHGGRRQRSRTPRRRRRHSPSSSRSRSRSGSRRGRAGAKGSSRSREASRSRDASPRDDGSPQRAQGAAWWGKGRGKAGSDGKRPTSDDLREKVRAYLNERLEAGDCRGRHKELQEDIQRTMGVNAKRFRALFQQTLSQYVVAYHAGGPAGPEAAWASSKAGAGQKEQFWAGPKVVSQGEQEMRAQRAARFQSHLEVDRKPVAMVSFNDDHAAAFDGGPIVGELTEMCARAESKEREMTRQLDKFEWKQGTDPRHPEVNLTLATKKYQRSSADKAYRSQDVRTLPACWRTMEFLMTEILDFDRHPKAAFAVQTVPYIEVYSYLRDRTRAVRVDLHLQQPRSTTQRTFVETHECCLRFEMLSLFLLAGGSGGSTEKYDEKLGLKAISQTIEPLLNAYQAVRDKQLARSILAEAMGDFCLDEPEADQDYCSPWEMAAHRYIILLLMSFSPEELLTHLAKLSRDTLSHPLVSFATQVWAAFKTEDYGRFLRCYRNADFLTAVAMSGVVDLARLRALWLLVRTYPQPIGDKVQLARIENFLAFSSEAHARSFLAFHGIRVLDDPASKTGPVVVLPKKGTPEAAQNPLLSGPSKLPDKCDFPKGADSTLVSKFEALGMSRADIVFGSADPIVQPDPSAAVVPLPPPPADPAAANEAGREVESGVAESSGS